MDTKIWQGTIRRVLIIKFGAIGDVVMAIPAAYALHLAGAEVHWVGGAAVAPLLGCYPWIRTIVVDDRAILKGSATERVRGLLGLWRTVGWTKYDLCVTLYYDARYRIVMLPIRARRKVILSQTDRARMLLPGRHHTDEYARILLGWQDGERPVGLTPVRAERLPVSPLVRTEGKARVVLAPAGAKNMMRDDALRRWPVENYVALASFLLKRGVEVILAGGPGDMWAVAAFAGLAVTNMTGKLTLPEMLALLEDSDVIVTHDTGPLHMAGITGVGIVSIFGPTDPRGRLPQRADTVALWGGEGFACRPCYDGRDYAPCLHNGCVRQVSVEMVIREVEAVMEQRRSERPMPPRVVTPMSTVVAKL
ncbi:glycosyltransferase family 9 protein [Edaphobacter sp. DSM 109919]|uniref:Glycosyltransferase family 9 protein n=1 Tax=Edaphobacter paludis TaxID=3035702 RepID=A0AAU7CW49_9BACT